MLQLIIIGLLITVTPLYCQEEKKYYVEILCTAEDEVRSITEMLKSQPWINKENILTNGSFILVGPYKFNEINDVRDKISSELNLPCNIYVDIFNNKSNNINNNPLECNIEVEEDDVVVSSYAKTVSDATLNIYNNEKVKKIIQTALELYTTPYRWGGTNVDKGIDCSFFVQYVFSKFGVKLPRTSREQFKVGIPVSREELKCGDLVFFKKTRYKKVKGKIKKYEYINHVGIYLVNGEFIHATINSKKVTISSLDEPYFKIRFAGARRVLKEEGL